MVEKVLLQDLLVRLRHLLTNLARPKKPRAPPLISLGLERSAHLILIEVVHPLQNDLAHVVALSLVYMERHVNLVFAYGGRRVVEGGVVVALGLVVTLCLAHEGLNLAAVNEAAALQLKHIGQVIL